MLRQYRCALGAFGLVLMITGSALAGTVYVSDYGELSNALRNVQNGTAIVLTDNITLQGNINFRGNGSAVFTVDGGGHTINANGFYLYRFDDAFGSLKNITIENASTTDGAAAWFVGRTTPDGNGDALSNSTFRNNESRLYAGAFGVASGALNGNVRGNLFENNRTTDLGYGGAFGVGLAGVTGSFIDNTFRGNNSATYAGAIHIRRTGEQTMVGNFEENLFEGNYATSYGGAVVLQGSLTGNLIGNTFDQNEARGGYGGAFLIRNGSLYGSMTGNTFSTNSASTYGGAVLIEGALTGGIASSSFTGNVANGSSSVNGSGGALYLTGRLGGGISDTSLFDSNTGTMNGGAIFVGGAFEGGIANSTFSNNSSSGGSGGALYVTGNFSGGITGSRFTGNHVDGAGGSGGAVYFNNAFSGAFTNSVFSGNTAQSNGGALYFRTALTGGITGGQFTNNSSTTGSGGAIYVNGNLSGGITGAVFDSNSAATGAGLFVNGTLNGDILDSTFRSNSSTSQSGAFWATNGLNGSIRNSIFAQNQSGSNGGAVSLVNGLSGTNSIVSATFNSNQSGGNGGGVYTGGNLTISGSTFEGNTATGGGGGVYADNAVLTVTDTNFLRNTATSGGAALFVDNGTLNINVSDSTETTYLGNLAGATANSITMEGTSGTLNINTGSGAILNMRDPFNLATTGSMTVRKEGEGIWKLAGDSQSSTAGTTMTIAGGTLELSRNNAGSSRATDGTLTLSGAGSSFAMNTNTTLIVDGENALDVNGSITFANNTTIEKGAGNMDGDAEITLGATSVELQGTTTLYANSGTLTVSNPSTSISGTGGIRKTGTGRVVLEDVNSYTGGTTVAEGTLAISDVNATGANGSAVVINAGATLELAFDSGTNSYDAVLSDSGNLLKTGGGTVTLARASGHEGITTINGGTLDLAQEDTLAKSSAVYLNSGSITSNMSQQFVRFESKDGTTLNLNGQNMEVSSGDAAGQILGVANFTKSGPGTFNVHKQLNITGALTVENGHLGIWISNSTIIPSIIANSVTFGPNATLDINGYTGTGGERSNQIVIQSATDIARLPKYTIAGMPESDVDFLTLQLRFDGADRKNVYLNSYLRWYDPNPLEQNGVFTLVNANNAFTVETDLVDQAPSAGTGWDGISLTKKGNGTLTLSGTNTYSGLTTVENGTLVLTHVNASGNNIDSREMRNNGILLFDTDADGTYAQRITGTGSVAKTSDGILTLSNGANSYAGATQIDEGTLAITDVNAAGVNSANKTVAVAEGATFAFTGGASGDFNKTIGGAGTVVVDTTGDVVLTAANAYTGGTTVESGTVTATNTRALGNGGVRLASGTGLDLEFDGVFANDMLRGTVSPATPDGEINTRGNIFFTGDHTDYDGTVNVRSGTLTLGTPTFRTFSSGADYIVYDGARLAGSGTIGRSRAPVMDTGLLVQTGGTVSPGYSIGSILVNGNVEFQAGSFYEVEVDFSNNNNSDRITATGSANLGNATVVYLGGIGGSGPGAGNRWLIVATDDGLNGTEFSGVTTRSRYLTPELEYDVNNAYLVLRRNDTGFGDELALTGNQSSVADALETLNPGSDLYAQVTALGDDDDIPYAYDLLSGEMHASLAGALGNYNRSIFTGLRRRIMDNPDCGFPLWASVESFYSTSRASRPVNTARARFESYGVSVGGEFRPGNQMLLGLAFRYGDGTFKVNDRLSRADVDSYNFSLYSGWDVFHNADSTFKLLGGAGYGLHRSKTRRHITAPLTPSTLRSKYNSNSYLAYAEALYQYRFDHMWTFEPYLSLEFDMLRNGSIHEQGGAAALVGDREWHNNITSSVGTRVQFQPSRKVKVGLDAAWQHMYGKRTPDAQLRFAAGSGNFRIKGAPYARSAARIGVDATYSLRECLDIQLAYDGVFSSGYTSHGGSIKVQWGF